MSSQPSFIQHPLGSSDWVLIPVDYQAVHLLKGADLNGPAALLDAARSIVKVTISDDMLEEIAFRLSWHSKLRELDADPDALANALRRAVHERCLTLVNLYLQRLDEVQLSTSSYQQLSIVHHPVDEKTTDKTIQLQSTEHQPIDPKLSQPTTSQ